MRSAIDAEPGSWLTTIAVVPCGAGQLADQLVDDGGVLRVELAGRLVGEQEPRAVGERGAERDPLLLAAGELVRVGVEPVLETDLAEQLGRRACAARGATRLRARA